MKLKAQYEELTSRQNKILFFRKRNHENFEIIHEEVSVNLISA